MHAIEEEARQFKTIYSRLYKCIFSSPFSQLQKKPEKKIVKQRGKYKAVPVTGRGGP
jgi:hypothetical protein